MCGRVVVATPRDLLASELGVDEVVAPDLGPRWNVAPTALLYAVAGRRSEAGGAAEARPVRRMGAMVWGLLPSWAAGPDSGPRPINARVESLGDRPHFAGALAGRRCLVPVDGFYEWGGTGTRRPFFLASAEHPLMALAAIWDRWVPATGDAEPVLSCALVTAPANDDVAPLHDRMPVVVEPENRDEWLDPANRDEGALLELLRFGPPGRLVSRPVSRLVNSTANDGPALLSAPEPDEREPTMF
ncbi:MAG: SOS response-associated peptidase [Acidimicrobiales bacterium]